MPKTEEAGYPTASDALSAQRGAAQFLVSGVVGLVAKGPGYAAGSSRREGSSVGKERRVGSSRTAVGRRDPRLSSRAVDVSFRSITIKKALDQISRSEFVLPAIQREFVWSNDQIARLFDSILRDYPIGTFLFWNVPPELSRSFRFYGFMREYHELKSRHSQPIAVTDPRTVTAVLDGQQRLTALNIGLLGYLATRKKFGRAGNPAAYPKRYLHLDVQYNPSEEDDNAQYRFEFLTEEQASHSDADETWFRVGDILDLGEGADIFRWVQANGLAEHPSAFPTLDRLWRAVHAREAVSFFEDESSSIDRVLEIFVRTNSGGTVLSKSDLLLSVATAQFTQLDARSAVHGLVDDLNSIGQGFSFTKDNVLKAGLMITDRADIRFRVDAFTTENVAALEENWSRIEQALRVAVRLLASFGFSERTLSAASVLLPLSDYIAFRGLGDDYLTSTACRDDRELVRRWVTRSLLKQGIWGSGLDTLLTRLRRTIRASASTGFPARELDLEMAAMGKAAVLSSAELEELVEVPINNRRAFPLLALLYPGVDTRNEFHIDHVFPRSLFASRKLAEANVDGDLHDEYQDLRDRLPNLQLLEGAVNVSKQATLPSDWVKNYVPDPVARSGWLAANDLTHMPDGMDGFLDFYEIRRSSMLQRLHRLLGDPALAHPLSSDATPPAPPQHVASQDVDLPAPVVPPSPQRPNHGYGVGRRRFDRRLEDLPEGAVQYRHHGVNHVANIAGGRIVLEDGRSFDSPSPAARAVNGDVSVNGWKAWTRDGRPIAELVDRSRRA